MDKEIFEDHYFLRWTIDDLIDAQDKMKTLIELYNDKKKIRYSSYLNVVEECKNTFQDIYETFDMLIDETYPE